jgi:hypothetical protein
MQKTIKRKPARQKALNGQQDRLNEASQVTNGRVQELEQEISNLKALLDVVRKEIDALNALVRYLERHRANEKT